MIDTKETDALLAITVKEFWFKDKLTLAEMDSVVYNLQQSINDKLMDISTRLRLTNGAINKTRKNIDKLRKRLKDDKGDKNGRKS
jgi:hypothetical protein